MSSVSKVSATTQERDLIELEIKNGSVIIELYSNKAPKHVQRIKDLCEERFYDGLKFHRVIENFMVQAGDPNGNGTGGSTKSNLSSEFNDTEHRRGVMSMARSQDPDSANSQFFIMLEDGLYLDGQYTAFGRVIKGMEFIDMIQKGSPSDNGLVLNPDKIIKMRAVVINEGIMVNS